MGVMGPGSIGRVLIALGVLLALAGLVFLAAERFPGLRIGRLPGDLRISRPGFTFYFPIATSILVSIALSVVFWILGRFR